MAAWAGSAINVKPYNASCNLAPCVSCIDRPQWGQISRGGKTAWEQAGHISPCKLYRCFFVRHRFGTAITVQTPSKRTQMVQILLAHLRKVCKPMFSPAAKYCVCTLSADERYYLVLLVSTTPFTITGFAFHYLSACNFARSDRF